jgi:hypothetical protein
MSRRGHEIPGALDSADGFEQTCTLLGATWHVATSWLIRESGPCSADPNLLITITRNGRKVIDDVYADIACWEGDATFASALITENAGGTSMRLCLADSQEVDHCKVLRSLPTEAITNAAAMDLLYER